MGGVTATAALRAPETVVRSQDGRRRHRNDDKYVEGSLRNKRDQSAVLMRGTEGHRKVVLHKTILQCQLLQLLPMLAHWREVPCHASAVSEPGDEESAEEGLPGEAVRDGREEALRSVEQGLQVEVGVADEVLLHARRQQHKELPRYTHHNTRRNCLLRYQCMCTENTPTIDKSHKGQGRLRAGGSVAYSFVQKSEVVPQDDGRCARLAYGQEE